MSLKLHIVTPARNVLSTTCEDIVLPGYDGEMGVLSEHAQFINKLGAGIIHLKSEGGKKIAISGGVVEIGNNEVTVLADEAVYANEVNLQKLEQEQQKVSAELMSLSEDSSDREKLFEKQRWIIAQRDLVQK